MKHQASAVMLATALACQSLSPVETFPSREKDGRTEVYAQLPESKASAGSDIESLLNVLWRAADTGGAVEYYFQQEPPRKASEDGAWWNLEYTPMKASVISNPRANYEVTVDFPGLSAKESDTPMPGFEETISLKFDSDPAWNCEVAIRSRKGGVLHKPAAQRLLNCIARQLRREPQTTGFALPEERAIIRGPLLEANAVAFSPDGVHVVVAHDYDLALWRTDNIRRIASWGDGNNSIGNFCYDSDGNLTLFYEDSVVVADRRGREIRRVPVDDFESGFDFISGPYDFAAIPETDKFVVVASFGGFGDDDGDFCSMGLDGQVDGKVFSFHLSERNLEYLVAPDGRVLVTAGDDALIGWSLENGEQQWSREIEVDCMSVSLDGTVLAIGVDGPDGEAHSRTLELGTGKDVAGPFVHRDVGYLTAIAAGSGGRVLACGRRDGVIDIVDTNSGKIIQQLVGHGDRINSLAVSPNGDLLASASDDESARLWNVAMEVGTPVVQKTNSPQRCGHSGAHEQLYASLGSGGIGATLASASATSESRTRLLPKLRDYLPPAYRSATLVGGILQSGTRGEARSIAIALGTSMSDINEAEKNRLRIVKDSEWSTSTCPTRMFTNVVRGTSIENHLALHGTPAQRSSRYSWSRGGIDGHGDDEVFPIVSSEGSVAGHVILSYYKSNFGDAAASQRSAVEAWVAEAERLAQQRKPR